MNLKITEREVTRALLKRNSGFIPAKWVILGSRVGGQRQSDASAPKTLTPTPPNLNIKTKSHASVDLAVLANGSNQSSILQAGSPSNTIVRAPIKALAHASRQGFLPSLPPSGRPG